MLVDSYIVPECAASPRSFGGLMALYESNFIKLGRLVGNIVNLDDNLVSTTPGDCDLFLWVESTARYTHILRMTYLFDEQDSVVADPDLIIRVYLDARMAEVAGWAEHHRHAMLQGLANRFGQELDRRWSNNMMLSKWLDYLIDAGHSFSRAAERAEALAR
ncbi:MAG: DUF1249 domain-containing protein [Gammaproteobacteria bacterium]